MVSVLRSITSLAAVLLAAALFGSAAHACTGDYNYDGKTNADDNTILTASYGACYTYCPYDLDHSGTVDAADLTIQKTLPDCALGVYKVNTGGKTWSWTLYRAGVSCEGKIECSCSLTHYPELWVTDYSVNGGAKTHLPAMRQAPLFCRDVGLSDSLLAGIGAGEKVQLFGKVIPVTPPPGALVHR